MYVPALNQSRNNGGVREKRERNIRASFPVLVTEAACLRHDIPRSMNQVHDGRIL